MAPSVSRILVGKTLLSFSRCIRNALTSCVRKRRQHRRVVVLPLESNCRKNVSNRDDVPVLTPWTETESCGSNIQKVNVNKSVSKSTNVSKTLSKSLSKNVHHAGVIRPRQITPNSSTQKPDANNLTYTIVTGIINKHAPLPPKSDENLSDKVEDDEINNNEGQKAVLRKTSDFPAQAFSSTQPIKHLKDIIKPSDMAQKIALSWTVGITSPALQPNKPPLRLSKLDIEEERKRLGDIFKAKEMLVDERRKQFLLERKKRIHDRENQRKQKVDETRIKLLHEHGEKLKRCKEREAKAISDRMSFIEKRKGTDSKSTTEDELSSLKEEMCLEGSPRTVKDKRHSQDSPEVDVEIERLINEMQKADDLDGKRNKCDADTDKGLRFFENHKLPDVPNENSEFDVDKLLAEIDQFNSMLT